MGSIDEWFWFSTEWKWTGDDLTNVAGQLFILDKSPLGAKVLLDHFCLSCRRTRATPPKAKPASNSPSMARPKTTTVVVTRTTPSSTTGTSTRLFTRRWYPESSTGSTASGHAVLGIIFGYLFDGGLLVMDGTLTL